MFNRAIFSNSGGNVILNYTAETSNLVDNIIVTKSSGANVVKGTQIN